MTELPYGTHKDVIWGGELISMHRKGTARRDTTTLATPSHLQYPVNTRIPAPGSCWK